MFSRKMQSSEVIHVSFLNTFNFSRLVWIRKCNYRRITLYYKFNKALCKNSFNFIKFQITNKGISVTFSVKKYCKKKGNDRIPCDILNQIVKYRQNFAMRPSTVRYHVKYLHVAVYMYVDMFRLDFDKKSHIGWIFSNLYSNVEFASQNSKNS